MVDHVGEVLRLARVLDIQEDRAPAGGTGALRFGRRDARGEGRLDRGQRNRRERQRLGLDFDCGLRYGLFDDRPRRTLGRLASGPGG
jgi:hypothetical protein